MCVLTLVPILWNAQRLDFVKTGMKDGFIFFSYIIFIVFHNTLTQEFIEYKQ